MVAIAAGAARTKEGSASLWLAGALVVLIVGTAARLVVRPIDVAAASAALLAALLWLGAWLVAMLVASPRGAFLVAVVAMLLLDLAALAPRPVVFFDDQQALYRTDQTLTVRVPPGRSELVVQVDAMFEGAQPRFALAGYSCALRRGRQYLAFAVPAGSERVDLRLTGAPNREREYLVVYTSSRDEQPTASAATVCE